MLLERRCVTCDSKPPECPVCPTGQSCRVLSQNCDSCASTQCVATGAPTGSSSAGVSKGTLAGAIIGILLFLSLILSAVWYLHKRSKARKLAMSLPPSPKPEVPAAAATVLSRPDPVEKVPTEAQGRLRVFSTHSDTTINLDPSQNNTASGHREPSLASNPESAPRNPFSDDLSLQSSSERSQSNIIPIALVPYGSGRPGSGTTSHTPARPSRSPDVDLRNDPPRQPSPYDLAHVNVSNDNVSHARNKNLTTSIRSNMTGMSDASYLSTGTYATDLFTESPTIVTRQQGRILGISKAQVVEVPSNLSSAGSPLASSHLTPGPRSSRVAARSIRSPLAQNSFTPADIIEMEEQPELSPFADSNAHKDPSVRSNLTTDVRSVRTMGTYNQWGDNDAMSIASGVDASITSATRVIVRGNSRAVSLEQPSVDPRPPRFSYASEASSRADSILESFPFVPPSPGQSRSSRTFGKNGSSSPAVAEPPSTISGTAPPPPKRHLLGMSALSTATNASSGLESFPFELQITDTATEPRTSLPEQNTRASLDTLALSRDLSAFPLAYDEVADPHGRPKTTKAPIDANSTVQRA